VDGESDEPETLGSITLGSREKLDNLIWVVNCNLQRLDGPVRGNASIIQELEGIFRAPAGTSLRSFGAMIGTGCLKRTSRDCWCGACRSVSTANFRTSRPRRRLRAQGVLWQVSGVAGVVADMSDEQLAKLRRGGHDPKKSTTPTSGHRNQGPADGDPREDGQGLWLGRGW